MRSNSTAAWLVMLFAFVQPPCLANERSANDCPADSWHEGFETYQAGEALAGQSDWQHGRPERKDEATASVVADDAFEDEQAVAIFQDAPGNRVFSISRSVPQQDGVVWVDAHIKPPATRIARPSLEIRDDQKAVTHVGFAADGRDVVYSSFTRPYWRVFRDFACTEPRWYRLTERIDFDSGTWALWIDGALHSNGLPLIEGAQQVNGIRIAACGTKDDPALVDKLYIGPTPPADINVPEAFPPREKGHLFRFAFFGDPQIGFGDKQPPHARDVIRLKTAIAQVEAAGCDLVLCCGDLVHSVTDAATAGLLDATATFKQARWCPVPGNHDPDAWYQTHIRDELDYVVEHKGVTFIGMKTWGKRHQGQVMSSQLTWLKSQLREAQQKAAEVVIWCHVTPYGPNPRGWWIREGQEEMLGLCKEYGVLAVLAGHFHRELWHFEQDGTHHIIAPGITLSRGELGWVVYDVYPDRVVQHFKPLLSSYVAEGQSEDHVVKGPLTFIRRAPVSAGSGR